MKPNPSSKPADAYHHGDLRAALIGAAREALADTAPEAITLKSLALRLGVSQPAPYRHFAGRDALLAAVAADGFVRFGEALRAAAAKAAPDQKFERASLAYLDFARANIGVYRLMFASNLLRTIQDETLRRAATASFDFLLDAVRRHAPADRVDALAIWVWSTLHGLAMLDAEGLAESPRSPGVTPAAVVRQMVATLAAAASSSSA
jgi:AcrR family transcriptional regulator